MAHPGDGVPLSVALAAAKGQVSGMATDTAIEEAWGNPQEGVTNDEE